MSAPEADVAMSGTPVDAVEAPGTTTVPTPSPQKTKETQEIHEKYRKLKRRFFELEEKHKETSTELQRSGERNVKMREERNILLDRIIELEAMPGVLDAANAASPINGSAEAAAASGAFPRSLLDPHARTSFTENLRQAAAENEADADADADIDPALQDTATRADQDANKDKEAGDGDANSPVMVSSAGTRLRIRPVGGDPERSISPDSEPEDTPDNDESGEYSPNQKPSKRARRSSTDTVSPESKAPRRSSRRAPAAPAPAPAASTGPRTRLIQMPKKTTKRPLSPAPVAAPPQQQQQVEAPPPVQENVNGGNAHNEASSSNQPRLAFNPYYPYLGPPMANAPYPYANPYAYYMGAPMPGAPMAYMPPPHYGPPPPQQQRAPDNLAPRAAKPKRLKAHTVTSKSYSIPMVPRDKKGKPMLPLNVGIMTVINLGDVCMREHFHTERYIFPVGYEVTRRYLSTVDPSVEVVYHCTILDGGDGPKFQIIPSDVPDRPVIAGTATGAWSNIVKQANAIRNRQHSNSVSGPDFFGLGQNTIKHLIQELPNADRLRDYVWQHFVEGGPLGGRHAAVIPALPEEYDAALPIGPYYPPRAPVVRGESEHGESRRVSHYPPHIVAQAAAARQGSSQPPPQEQYQQQQQPPQQQEYDGSRVVMPPTPTSAGGSTSYYLPHTQQQTSGGRAVYPAGNNGAAGSNGVNGGGGSTFASIMNAFPTQDEGGPGPES